jgi:transcriptional regulator with XRE-family HTH domain
MSHQKAPRTPGGNRLRALRETYGQTQLDVELDASLGIGYLQRLELGKVQHPERDTLERILAALGVSFIERREVLGLFGYAVAISVPNELETRWAIDVFQSEVNRDSIPIYLLDCTHRLLAWNSLVCKVFGAVKIESDAVLMPRLLFDPTNGIASSVLNAETFFAAQIRILQFERQRCGDEAWYNGFVNEMRQYQAFDEYWTKHHAVGRGQVPMRPVAQLKLRIGDGLAHFRLISETFVQDPRFRVIYYMPADSATIHECLKWQS